MHNHKSYILSVSGLISCVTVFVACSSLPFSSDEPPGVTPLPVNSSIEMKLKSSQNGPEVTNYYSHSKLKNYEKGQLVKEREEKVEFSVQSEAKASAGAGEPRVNVLTETISKDGSVDLHDLAFPELGEKLEYVFTPEGEVVRAGDFPFNSIFYVPPVPLPKKKVRPGDTWTMQQEWTGLKNGIPLQVDLVVIFKNLYPCGKERCADLEVSGSVGLVGAEQQPLRFNSEIMGRILFNVDRGVPVWSEVKSRENLVMPETRVNVVSCLGAHLKKPKAAQWKAVSEAHCEPDWKAREKIPGTYP